MPIICFTASLICYTCERLVLKAIRDNTSRQMFYIYNTRNKNVQ